MPRQRSPAGKRAPRVSARARPYAAAPANQNFGGSSRRHGARDHRDAGRRPSPRVQYHAHAPRAASYYTIDKAALSCRLSRRFPAQRLRCHRRASAPHRPQAPTARVQRAHRAARLPMCAASQCRRHSLQAVHPRGGDRPVRQAAHGYPSAPRCAVSRCAYSAEAPHSRRDLPARAPHRDSVGGARALP